MTFKNTFSRTRRSLNAGGLIPLVVATCLGACGGGGGGNGGGGTSPPPPPSPPAAATFQASLDAVSVIDRSDGSTVQVEGASVNGATLTLR